MPPFRRLLSFHTERHDSSPTSCTPPVTFCYSSPPPPPSLPPPPPPRPPTPPPSPPPHSLSFHPSPLILSLLVVLPAAFLLVLFSSFFVLRRRTTAASPSPPQLDDEELLYEEGEAVNHVWFVRTSGLDSATIAAITRIAYAEGAVDGGDCAVCLAAFRPGEVLRVLPGCRHAFHLPCIDAWLAARTSCPLCRSPVVVVVHSGTNPEAPTYPALGVDEEYGGESLVVESSGLEVEEDASSSVQVQQSLAAESSGRWRPAVWRRSVSFDEVLVGASWDRHGGEASQKGVMGMERSTSSDGGWRFMREHRRANSRSSVVPL